MRGVSNIPLGIGGGESMSAVVDAPRTTTQSMQPLIERILRCNPGYQRDAKREGVAQGLPDFLVTTPNQPHLPGEVFNRLRWGGLMLFVSESRHEVANLAPQFNQAGFRIEQGPAPLLRRLAGLPIPFLSPSAYYFVARKVLLLPPGQATERFTYQVQLAHYPRRLDPLVVLKEVPSFEAVAHRLRQKFPDTAAAVIQKRARKFTEKIFPTFLTREAAMLEHLETQLPEPYCRRVPRVIDLEKDGHGLVRRLRMNWLRNCNRPLSQLEFAHQSADLLCALHDIGHVIHLDLRLDNFVITEDGVGFVDFGSAVREDEDIQQNPVVGSLFEELMRTSQIQRMLNQMTLAGHVTSDIIRRSRQKVDKAVDFFYLAVQFNYPHANPDLADLIDYDPDSQDAVALTQLTAEILRPVNPARPVYRSARDILRGIEQIREKMAASK
ncbi:MAG TPA: hypothetical protein VHP11_17210 [Tepidisphaeraceae bacterium]|nr:hypothetical protein [Tepidisphaeraceae bacterium]